MKFSRVIDCFLESMINDVDSECIFFREPQVLYNILWNNKESVKNKIKKNKESDLVSLNVQKLILIIS